MKEIKIKRDSPYFWIITQAITKHAGLSFWDRPAVESEVVSILMALYKAGYSVQKALNNERE